MNSIVRNISFSILIILLSCDKHGSFLSCNECFVKEPVVFRIEAKVDFFDPSNRPTEIRVFEGNLEDSLLLRKFAAQNGPVEIEV
jgi:hypothetical protein